MSRQATRQTDASEITAPSGSGSATSSFRDLSSITNSLSSQAGHITAIKRAHSVLDSASSGLATVIGQLESLKAVAVTGTFNSLTSTQRETLGGLLSESLASIQSVSDDSKFEDQKILDGSYEGEEFTLGPNTSDALTVSLFSLDPNDLGIGGITVDSFEDATDAVKAIDAAIATVSALAGELSLQQRQFSDSTRHSPYSKSNIQNNSVKDFSLRVFSDQSNTKSAPSVGLHEIAAFVYQNNDLKKNNFSIVI